MHSPDAEQVAPDSQGGLHSETQAPSEHTNPERQVGKQPLDSCAAPAPSGGGGGRERASSADAVVVLV